MITARLAPRSGKVARPWLPSTTQTAPTTPAIPYSTTYLKDKTCLRTPIVVFQLRDDSLCWESSVTAFFLRRLSTNPLLPILAVIRMDESQKLRILNDNDYWNFKLEITRYEMRGASKERLVGRWIYTMSHESRHKCYLWILLYESYMYCMWNIPENLIHCFIFDHYSRWD